MNKYTDFYDVVVDGFHRVIEFTCSPSAYRPLRTELACAKDDNAKVAIFAKHQAQGTVDSIKMHLPTFGGKYPNGKPAKNK